MSATVKTINTGVLAIAYLEYGPASGWPCIMGHGFPYDAHAYDQAAPIPAHAGARVIVPYLRGYGPTRFLKVETPRSGEQASLGVDLAHHAKKFAGPHQHRIFKGAGHNLPQERPEEWAGAVIVARAMALG